MAVAVDKVEAADCLTVNTVDSSNETVVFVVWLRVTLWKLEVTRRLLTRNSCKFVEKDITLRKFMFQASKLGYCSLCCIFLEDCKMSTL